jgi:DNA-binding NtrC family response regulator
MERLRRQEFDVLLTDLRLTDRDGMELITDLPDAAPSTRPILMSAFATAKDSQRATNSAWCEFFANLRHGRTGSSGRTGRGMQYRFSR